MTKYQIKSLLTTKNIKELRKIAKGVSLEKANTYLKDDLIKELADTLASMESSEEFELTEEYINKLAFTTIDNIISEIEMLNMQECAVTSYTDEDFNTNNKFEEENNMNTEINLENINELVKMVYAELKTENNKVDENGKRVHDFNERPSNILKIALKELDYEERFIDVAYVMTYGVPQGQDDYRGTVQLSDENILLNYDKEQNASRDFYINNSMMCKPPTDGQRSALNKCIEVVENVPELIDELAKLKKVKRAFGTTAYDFKIAIEEGYNSLANTKPTKGQIKFIDSITSLGISYGKDIPNTYGKARDFITASMPLFNRKCLIRDLQNQGVNGLSLDTIANFDDQKIKDLNYKMKKLANILGMTFAYYKECIWTLIERLDNMKPSELLKLQRACIGKEEDTIIEQLYRTNTPKQIIQLDNQTNPEELTY